MARRFATFLLDILPGLVLLAALALALWAATGHVRTAAYDPASPSQTAVAPRTAPEWSTEVQTGSDALYGPFPTPSSEAVIPAVGIPVSDVSAQPQSGAPDPGLEREVGTGSGRSTTSQAAKGGGAAPRLAAIGTSSSAGPTPKVDASSCVTPCFVTVGWLVRQGIASNYGPRFSEWWVALPDGPGWKFRVCGPGGCRTLVSTDAGPAKYLQRAPYNRVVDLPVGAFSDVCGVSWTMGLCNVELTMLGRVR